MSNQHSDRERWEIYLTQILLYFRPLLFIGGCIFLVYAAAALFAYPLSAVLSAGLGLFLFALVFSDRVALSVARFGAYLATIRDVS